MESESEKSIWKKTLANIKPDRGTVDFNRSGIPLIEIVTEPDIKSPEEARTFLKELIRVLQYSGGARGEGTMRADVNISIEGGTE